METFRERLLLLRQKKQRTDDEEQEYLLMEDIWKELKRLEEKWQTFKGKWEVRRTK